MLAEARPDVLHVATSPHSHRAVALRALASGAHVYVEKPFVVDSVEADAGRWTRLLPGGLFQNVMPYAVCRITDFLPDEKPRVWAT